VNGYQAFIAIFMIFDIDSPTSFGSGIVRCTSSCISGRIEGGTGGSLIGRLNEADRNRLDFPGLVSGNNKALSL
jgi:hypothetical protein